VRNISNLLSKRQDYTQTVSTIIAKIPAGLTVGVITAAANKIDLAVSGASLKDINQFVDSMTGLVGRGKIVKSVTVQGIALDSKSQIYSVRLEMLTP
jgi:hypothetical protein